MAGAGTTASASAAEDLAVDRATMLTALAELTDVEREAVLLVAWDGLVPADAAKVAGCSRNAFDVRLHRARRRLERSCAPSPPARPGPVRFQPRRGTSMSNDSSDVMDKLAHLRPEAENLEQRWPTAQRAELAERIRRDELGAQARLHHRPAPRRFRSRRYRLVAVSTLVAAVVATAVVVPTLLPEGTPGGASPAAAAALERLARVAADTPADTASPGQFVHTVVRNHQVGVFLDGPPYPGTRDLDDRYESWTGSDGQVWRRDTAVAKARDGKVDGGGKDTLFFPASVGEAGYDSSLPTDADELEIYLRSHVHGSSSTDEAVFGALGDVLRSTTAPATLRSTALTVLARTDHVSLGSATTDSQGRRVQEFVFADDLIRPGVVQRFYVDPRTAQLLEERATQSKLVNTTTMLASDIVNFVPTGVRRKAVSQE